MKRLTKLFWTPFVIAALCLPGAHAQPQAPPATNPQTSSGSGQSAPQKEPASPVVGAAPTITGGLAPNVGDSGDTHSQITAGVQYSELFDSSFLNSAGTTGWDAVSTFGGHFELRRTGASSGLLLNYSGGGYVDPKNSVNDSTFHQFQASETLQFRRWTLQLVDLFSYLPQSSFGFGGAGVGGSPFLGITILNPALLPGQGILSTAANRVSNTALAQVSYSASQRTTWTFGGSYGVLDFTSPGYLNSADYGASVGYNYQLTSRDIIGFSYQFEATRFSPAIASINNNTFNVNYGRHITNELSFQVGAGPELSQYNPVGVPSTGTRIAWNLNTGLNYLYGRTTTNVSFTHGVTAGAGILTGATTDLVSVGISHPIGPYMSVNGSFGASGNTSLPQAGIVVSSYATEFATIGITRKLGQQASIFATYNLTRQTTNGAPCVGPACGPQVLRHQIYIGFSWDLRPVPLR